MLRRLLKSHVLVAALGLMAHADFQGATHLVDLDHGGIRYGQEKSRGRVARLVEDVESGSRRLEWDDRFGWMPSLLRALEVSTNSQMLVFSKTSLQREHIHPHNPRAIYFNEDTYVGYIPGAPVMELSEVDGRLGGVFYTLDHKRTHRPQFKRVDNCIECHASARTMGVPGHLVRSFETDANGVVDLSTGTDSVDDRTPLSERWGGWYVTGTHGAMTHRGNRIGEDFARARKDPSIGGNRLRLDDLFPGERYPSPGSDIVALMVFEHQAHLHNFIARLQYMATQHLSAYGHVDYLNSPLETFVKALLFSGEAPLTSKVVGDPAFVKSFESAGRRDPKGRSLRTLDLGTRLFRTRCSFLVHSDAFTALPGPMKERIYRRLGEVLSAATPPEGYAHLDAAERTTIREILAATLADLPSGWPTAAAGGSPTGSP
jgi:hypothetical protein